jgi:predicted transcriptional regulator
MRFHETLEDILGSKIKIRILRLFYRTKGSYTGREIAKLIECSQEATRKALIDLVNHGLRSFPTSPGNAARRSCAIPITGS